MAGDKQPIQIRTRKFIRNALLARKQFVSRQPSRLVYFYFPYYHYYNPHGQHAQSPSPQSPCRNKQGLFYCLLFPTIYLRQADTIFATWSHRYKPFRTTSFILCQTSYCNGTYLFFRWFEEFILLKYSSFFYSHLLLNSFVEPVTYDVILLSYRWSMSFTQAEPTSVALNFKRSLLNCSR